jgi:methyl-accepting chemotaxis protein
MVHARSFDMGLIDHYLGKFARNAGTRAAASQAAAAEVVSSAIMMVDRELRVTYANAATRRMLADHAAHFRALHAGFTPEGIIGQCIDVFHKDPAHQRRMLADPSRLPHHAHIQVGPLTFALHVHALRDSQGNYIGNILEWADATLLREQQARLAAIDKVQAVVEFTLDGLVTAANPVFLGLMGYTLDELKGRHHRVFVEPAYAQAPEYEAFWNKLRRGEHDQDQYCRLAKGGREVWIEASYNPILDAHGRPCKVIKFATDVTAQVVLRRALDAAITEVREVGAAALAGDLSHRLQVDATQEQVGALAGTVNGLLDMMSGCISGISGAVAEVRTGADEISRGNANLSQRTEEQASSLEQTAASMEQMASTIKHTSDNIEQANRLAIEARRQSESGGAVVSRTIEAMDGINVASKKIAEIIGVIDGIAFQTNLLALNAAVEAARAGEQGRGFAVVASEVRSLAGRSATAAREIKSLIQDTVEKIGGGTELVNESGRVLGEMARAIKHVTDVMGEIASAAHQQASGINEVNKAVTVMDEVTQQNAALVEQAAAASQSILEQATRLDALVAHYKVSAEPARGQGQGQAMAPGPEPARSRSRAAAPRPTPAAPAAERRGTQRPWSRQPARARDAVATGSDWREY